MSLAVVAIGTSIIGAGASLIGGSKAASAQKSAANTASATELEMYYQSREDTAPWREAGVYGLNKLIGTPATSTGGYWQMPDGSRVYGSKDQMPTVGSQATQNQATNSFNLINEYNKYIQSKQAAQDSFGAGYEGQDFYNQPSFEQWLSTRKEPTQSPTRNFLPWATKPYGGGTPSQGTSQGGGSGQPVWVEGTETPGEPGLLEGPGEFESSPGYEFVKAEGLKAINNALSARGRVDSGPAARQAARYVTGLASQEYGNFWNRYQDKIRGYQSLAGLGQSAANQSAQNAMATGQNIAGLQAAGISGAGNAQAAGIMGAGNAINQGIGNYMLYNALKA